MSTTRQPSLSFQPDRLWWPVRSYEPRYDDISLDHLTVDGAPQVLQVKGVSPKADGTTIAPIGSMAISNSSFKNITTAANQLTGATVTWQTSAINGKLAK